MRCGLHVLVACVAVAPAIVLAAGCGPSPAFEPQAVVVLPQAQQDDWSPATDDPALPFAVGQNWVGRYTCAQGETALVLHVVDIQGPEVFALFDFDHNPTQARGLFRMHGTYRPEGREITLEPGAWVERPNNYVTVALTGKVTPNGRVFAGRVLGPGCTRFQLTKTVR